MSGKMPKRTTTIMEELANVFSMPSAYANADAAKKIIKKKKKPSK